MGFAAEPENDFNMYIEKYFRECRERCPKIEAIAGKWSFEDLIPGMSDFDTRFICSDDMTAQDWCDMSEAVGEAHLEICREHPGWARKLEHLPGINLTWKELTDDFTYYPEYLQWTFYDHKNKNSFDSAMNYLRSREWDERDEYFHLKKFLLYFTPYNRDIDPAVNLGIFEDKYPLHSRIMHYFDPPVQSAVSLIQKKTVKGKKEAFRIADIMFPKITLFRELLDIVGRHYEEDALYIEPALSVFEERLYGVLKDIFEILKEHITVIPGCRNMTAGEMKKRLDDIKVPPSLVIFESSRFSRLMKGRMNFYSSAPEHFDSTWPIQNELKRIGNGFYRVPYRTFWQLAYGEEVNDPDMIIKKLVPDILTEAEAEATLEFSRLTPGTWEEGREKETASSIAAVFDDFYKGLYKIVERVKTLEN